MSANLNIFGGIAEKTREIFAETWRRNAVDSIQRYEVAREFWALILGFVLLRLATSAVSIFSGWAFFNVELSTLISDNTARQIIAVSLLGVIEVITAGFLFKFFKFIFSMRWGLAGAMLAGVAVFFFVSFHTSTRGIALYKSDTTDKNITIELKATAGVDSIANYYNQQIELLNASINEIRPQTWNKRHQQTADGRDTVVYLLTTAQEQTKTELYNKIIALQTEQREAVKEYRQAIDNEKHTTQATADTEAEKYYLYVVIIMLLQLTANGVLCFFYARIYHENNRADEITGEVAEFAATIADNTDALITRQTTAQYNTYLNGLQRRLLQLQAQTQPQQLTAQASNEATADGGTYRARAFTNIVSKQASNEASNETPNEATTQGQPTKQFTVKGFANDEANESSDRGRGVSLSVPQGSTGASGGESQTSDTTAPPLEHRQNTANERVVYVGDNIRYCKYCGRGFVPNHSKQIYCCNEHRGQACADRNGKSYWFAGVKYEPNKKGGTNE